MPAVQDSTQFYEKPAYARGCGEVRVSKAKARSCRSQSKPGFGNAHMAGNLLGDASPWTMSAGIIDLQFLPFCIKQSQDQC